MKSLADYQRLKNEETTAPQVKGFEGELKQVLDKAVSLSSH